MYGKTAYNLVKEATNHNREIEKGTVLFFLTY